MLNPLSPRQTPVAEGRPAPTPPLWPLVALPWMSVGALLLGWLLAPELLTHHASVPLLRMLLFGLPHGALDHLVPGRLGWPGSGDGGWHAVRRATGPPIRDLVGQAPAHVVARPAPGTARQSRVG